GWNGRRGARRRRNDRRRARRIGRAQQRRARVPWRAGALLPSVLCVPPAIQPGVWHLVGISSCVSLFILLPLLRLSLRRCELVRLPVVRLHVSDENVP